MRILLTTDAVGGVWTFGLELTRQLLAGGHHVALVSFGPTPSERQGQTCADLVRQWGDRFWFRASSVPLEWMQDNECAYASGVKLLTDLTQEFRPDVLHANQFCWGALPMGTPKLITAHSDVLSWARASKPSATERSAWLDRYCGLVQRGLDGGSAVAAPTEWMAQALRESFDGAGEVTVIANGRTAPATQNAHPRKLQAVTVGRLWDEAKGLPTLADVDSPMPILIAGADSFEDSGLAEAGALEALGWLDEAELFALFRESSIYLALSLYEPFGLAPLEAALCGCAVVARDLASLREVWGEDALYFHSAEELTAILHGLADDAKALASARANASARAERYTASRMGDAYLALYQQLLDSGRMPADAETWASNAA